MNRFINIKAIAMLTAAITTASCSIKEDRTPCPCWLDIDITSCAEHTNEVTLAGYNGSRLFSETVAVADYPNTYEAVVTKGMVTSTAVTGLKESTIEGSKILIPEGSESEQIRAHSVLVDCTGESAMDKVELHRQYATVHLSMKGKDEEVNPYDLRIIGDVCGIDITTLSPVSGAFQFSPKKDSDGTWIFRLPRQNEDTRIRAELLLDGSVLDLLPLHEWIRQTGYSWVERDLKEIYIGVDFGQCSVSVSIQGWNEGESLDIRI